MVGVERTNFFRLVKLVYESSENYGIMMLMFFSTFHVCQLKSIEEEKKKFNVVANFRKIVRSADNLSFTHLSMPQSFCNLDTE